MAIIQADYFGQHHCIVAVLRLPMKVRANLWTEFRMSLGGLWVKEDMRTVEKVVIVNNH